MNSLRFPAQLNDPRQSRSRRSFDGVEPASGRPSTTGAVIQFARQGYKEIQFDTYDTDWDSEAYLTVAGQNSNNSVRVTDAFLNAVEQDLAWDLTARTTRERAQPL